MVKLEIRDKAIPHSDYVYDNVKKFLRIQKAVSTLKLDGSLWRVVLVGLSIKEIDYVIENFKIPTVDIIIVVSKDSYAITIRKYPELKIKIKSSKDKFDDALKEYNVLVTPKAYYSLYRKIGNDAAKLDEFFDEFARTFPNASMVDVNHIDEILAVEPDNVYASDVINSLLVRGRYDIVPKKGHRLSGYHYGRTTLELCQTLEKKIGDRIAYLSLRKYVNKLVKEKTEFLYEGKDYKSAVVSVVDVVELLYLQSQFETEFIYGLAELAIVNTIKRREENKINDIL